MEQQKLYDLPPLIDKPESSDEIEGGPKFGEYDGWGKKISKWLRKYSPVIILMIVILTILVSGMYFGQKEKQSVTEESQIFKNSTGKIEKSIVQTLKENENIASDVITETTRKGEGITHLARRALSDYLKKQNPNEIKLSPEQKIYIEDYLQNKTGSYPLETGDEITFSKDLVQEAINSSFALTPDQINNLSKYVPLVPALALN